jgi:hypothetical protein
MHRLRFRTSPWALLVVAAAIFAAPGCGGPALSPTSSSAASAPAPSQSATTAATAAWIDPITRARMRANEIECSNHLKQIGIALHIYHDEYLVFPTHINPGPGGIHPGLGWRVAVLPYLEQKDLYKQFKLDEPWDGPNNKKLLAQMPDVYRDPRFQRKEEKPTETYYRGFTGEGTVFGTQGGAALGIITNANGTSRTLMIVEAAQPVIWTKPDELAYDPKKPLPQFATQPGSPFFFGLFVDGHVQRIPAKTDEKTLRYMIQWTNTTPFDLP